MLIADAEARFGSILRGAGSPGGAGDVARVVEAMLDWYRDERAEDAAALDKDGDMMLAQWGTYQWSDGLFEFGITRQFIEAAADDEDEGIYQLSAAFRFAPDVRADGLGSGSRWCSTPEALSDFRRWLHAQPAFAFATDATPESSVVSFDIAG